MTSKFDSENPKTKRDEADNASAQEPDKVGYKKPPKHSQFKKGKSGNPKGGKKSAKTWDSSVIAFMEKAKSVLQNGKHQKKHPMDIYVEQLFNQFLKGSVKAGDALKKMYDEALAREKSMPRRRTYAEEMHRIEERVEQFFQNHREEVESDEVTTVTDGVKPSSDSNEEKP